MAIDPLSPATRAIKKNLLIAATLAITFRAFDVSIEKLPLPGGITVNFDQRVFSFLLVALLLYLTATFALYYYADITDRERPQHRSKNEAWYQQKLDSKVADECDHLEAALLYALPAGIFLAEHSFIEAIVKNSLKRLPTREFVVSAIELYEKEGKDWAPEHKRLNRSKNAELYDKLASVAETRLRRFKLSYQLHRLTLLPRVLAVRAAFIVRDYGTDGIFPLACGVVALLAMYDVISLRWLQDVAPAPVVEWAPG
jgi:hypothetical protein